MHSVLPFLLAVGGVEAGNRAWEPPHHYGKAAIAARELSGVNNIYFNNTNVSTDYHAQQKRFFGLSTPAGSAAYPRLWPNGNINACFEQLDHVHGGQTKSTREILYNDLITARELWRTAGLDDKDGKFQFNILPDDDARCDRSQRSTHLLIMYAGEGVRKMSTSVGLTQPEGSPESGTALKNLGPTMTLTDVLDIGMKNIVPNYAHEMGHAWGLHHEHQNPRYWHEDFTKVARDDYYFSEENFICENLLEFDDIMERYANLPDYQRRLYRNQMCRDPDEASAVRFAGGFNYAPITNAHGMIDDGGKYKEPDWNSIMIYPSDAGGKTVAGVKQNVLTKRNGDLITPNSKPTERDVQGLKKMYGVSSSKFLGIPLGDNGNKLKNIFNKIRKKDSDSGCV